MCDHCGCGHPGQPLHHGESSTVVPVGEDVLAHERAHAESLRQRIAGLDARLINVIGGPGCGKTELLSVLIRELGGTPPCAVVEGDLATDNDARRIAETGAPVHQVTTGTVCHLTAHDVDHALDHLSVARGTLVLVENVGNLVCPSVFDLGESLRVVCLSVTEGTDKPLKYPVAFREAGLVVITKSDLLPHVDFDVDAARQMIDDLDPGTPVLLTSAGDGAGVDELAGHVRRLWDG
ncbi:MAG: hydrogenase nickel incorporation protein HypB [Deltaproteobacteria bacterium]|nr:hydrogenase nickel incorporation protein HypB [Deltaproteobacteria bacterium]